MPKQDSTKIISGKDLGQLASETFCPRCFWLERHLGKPPSIFPGIFNTLDSLSKKSTRRSFSERECKPDWLNLENIKRPVNFSRINVPLPAYGWILTGEPDDVFELIDGGHHIVDYKTAKFTEKQDSLYPQYEVQLNAYAYALPLQGIKPISKLSLIYCEPKEELDLHNEFRLTFTTYVVKIPIKAEIIPELLKRARVIIDNTNPPSSRFGCNGICSWIEKFQNKF
mgnify:FL=1